MSKKDTAVEAEDRLKMGIIWLMRVSIAVVNLWALVMGEWEAFFISLLALILTFVPESIERAYRIELPIDFEFVIILFMYAGIFLGEFANAYESFWWWDVMLHAASGVVLAFVGFLSLFILTKQGKLKASPLLVASLVFAVGMAAGGVWEIFEFSMDELFGLNMQKRGLVDTMWDLIVDAVGALAMAWAGYYYLKEQSRGFLHNLISSFVKANPHLKGKNG